MTARNLIAGDRTISSLKRDSHRDDSRTALGRTCGPSSPHVLPMRRSWLDEAASGRQDPS